MIPNLKIEAEWGDFEDLRLEAVLDGRTIGYANCTLSGNRLKLDDLHVYDSVVYPCSRLRCVHCRSETYTRNFRNQGVGKSLLARVFEEAIAKGAVEVWGVVVGHDLEKKPDLIDWYRRKGFEVSERDDECRDLPDALYKISKHI